MKNRLFTWLLCIAILLVISPMQVFAAETVASGECGDNLTWTLDDTGTLTISGTGDMMNYTSNSYAPWNEHREAIKTVVIENGVTSIGNYAFYSCTKLREITIPDGVTSIGRSAFSGCSSLTAIDIPDSVTVISDSAFSSCAGLTRITVPDSIISIGNSAFSDCSSLAAIDIPDGITTIGEYTFSSCSSLTSIDIPDSVSGIGNYTFYYCTKLTDISIPEGVETIGYYAFAYCSSLTGIDIPGTVTSIGMSAFEGCGSLTSIKFYGDAPAFSFDCFYGVTAMAYYPAGNPTWIEDVMHDHSGALIWTAYHSDNTHKHVSEITAPTCTERGYTTYTCPCGDSYVDDYVDALSHDWSEWEETEAATCTEAGSKTRSCLRCGETETETIPATDHTPDENGICTVCGYVPIVASGTWGENISWTLDAKGKLTLSGKGEMLNCGVQGGAWYSLRDKIYTVQVDEGITSLGSYAFTNSGNLTTVILPDSLRSIGGSVFHQCGDLAEITLPEHLERIEGYAFSYSGLVDIEIPESVTYLGEYAFTACTKLKTFTVSATLTKVPAGLLYGCKSLESVTIPEGITVIGEKAFCNCYALKRADIPSSVTKLEREAFAYNSSLEAVTLPEGLLTIDTYAFAGCTKLTEINLPNSVKSLGGCLFSGCSNLVSVHLPENIAELPGDLFYNCLKLENVNIPESVIAIGGGAFQNTSMTEITIPAGVTILEISVFRLCYGLTSITIPENVSQVRSAAFQDCKNLTEIIFTGHAPSIDSNAFTRVTATVFYPLNDPSWTVDVMNNYGGTLTWKGYCKDDGHAYESVVTLPTCEENGYTTYTCANCGDTYTADETAAEGHIWSDATCTAPMTCSVCDATEGDALGHDFDSWVVTKQPSASEEGLEVRECTRCRHEESRTIEKLSDPFSDVPEGAFYCEPVLWAVENGVTSGTSATEFSPLDPCLRAHVVTFLHRAAGNPEPEKTTNPFTDVASGSFFYKPVLWAVEESITNGTSATTFGSYDNCNRAAVVTFLWRAAGSPEPTSTNNPFVDVATTSYYYKAVLWAVENGITNGVDATHFGPTANCNRAQVVTFLYRAYNK